MNTDDPNALASTPDRREALWRRIEVAMARHPGCSGFTPLIDGIDALAARLLLADRAERVIDAQYYFILNDITGHLFVSQLLAAADRGVRVRLLLDDIATRGYELDMAQLDGHPNFEIRIFNPFSSRIGWMFDFITNFQRANRRMHNKSFTVDGMATVVGGRNIGAEYFSAREDVNFGDLDLLGLGPVARDVGFAFDEYWDSGLSKPVADLVNAVADPAAGLASLRDRLARQLEDIASTPYGEALRSTILERIQVDGDGAVEWAESRVVFDPPGKARGDDRDALPSERNLSDSLMTTIVLAEREIRVISPYFVPLDEGVELLGAARARGVRTVVVTNSLASSDVAAVHAGYEPYRKPLLDRGVELYETRAELPATRRSRPWLRFSRGSLHAKVFLIDRRLVYVGSFNWDPRSVGINTEMGILLDSPALAARLSDLTDEWLREDSWRVELDSSQRLRWVRRDGDREVLAVREPDAGFWRRVFAALVSLLPIRRQL